MTESKVLTTSFGMWGLWDYEKYKNVENYNEWSVFFDEVDDIMKQITSHSFVPINIGSDGAFEFKVIFEEDLNDRERKYILVSSKPYLIKSSGLLKLSGIEYIGGKIKDRDCITIPTGENKFVVVIHLIDWKAEKSRFSSDSQFLSRTLPDFIIEIKYKATLIDLNDDIRTF